MLNSFKNSLTTLFTLDVRSIAAFRICLGLLVLIDIATKLPDIVPFYTDSGLLPRSVLLEQFASVYRFSIHTASGFLWWQLLLFGFASLCAVSLIIGFKTKTSMVLTWVLMVSYHNRNELVLQGGDAVFHVLAFWALFLPLGSYFSLDYLLRKRKQDEEDGEVSKPESIRVSSVGILAIMAQIVMMNIFAGILKSGTEWTQTFDASLYASRVHYLTTPISRFFANSPRWSHTIFTFYLKWIEIIAPILLFIPFKNHIFRMIALVGVWAMLLVCGLNLQIATFPLIWGLGFVLFIPTEFWNWFFAQWKRPDIIFYYDEECSVCTTAACALESKLTTKTCQSDAEVFERMLDENTMTVVDENGATHTHYHAVLQLMRTIPVVSLFVPLLSLPLLYPLGNILYGLLARNRYKLSEFLNSQRPKKPLFRIPQFISEFFVMFMIIYVFVWNVGELYPEYKVPQPMDSIGWTLNLNQRWDMFAPTPLKVHGWYVMPGQTGAGDSVDVLYRKEGDVKWDRQANIEPPFEYSSQGWRKFFTDYMPNTSNGTTELFARYQCKTWNEYRTGDDRLYTFDIYFMRVTTLEDGSLTEPEKISLWSHRCYDK